MLTGGGVTYTELRDMPIPELEQLQEVAAEVADSLDG